MMKSIVLLTACFLTFASCSTAPVDQPSTSEPAATSAPPDETAQQIIEHRKHEVEEIRREIAGKEELPAEQVFKNIQVMKGVPAGRLLRIMDVGYANSLGVDCSHCHVEDEWDKDTKPQKQVAREMIKMTRSINAEYIKNIPNLRGPNPAVNCTTCHRGQVKPALDLPSRS